MSLRYGIALALAFLALLAAVYTGYWFYGAYRLQQAVDDYGAHWRDQGLEVLVSRPDTRGFPGAIDMSYSRVVLRDPEAGRSWLANDISLRAVPWRPTKLRLSFHGSQSVTVPVGNSSQTFRVEAGQADMVGWIAGDSGRLDHVKATISDLRIEGDSLFTAKAIFLDIALAAADGAPGETVTVRSVADGVTLPGAWRTPLGGTVERWSVKASVRPRPKLSLSEATLNAWRDAGGTISLDWLNMAWGPLSFKAQGEVALDRKLRPAGEAEVETAGLSETLKILGETGIVSRRMAGLAAAGAALFSVEKNAAGQPVLTVPVAVRDGGFFLGPFRIAELRPLFAKPEPRPDGAKPAPVAPVHAQPVPEILRPGGDPPTVSNPNLIPQK